MFMTNIEAAGYIGVTPGTLANYRSLGVGPAWSTKKTKGARGPARVVYKKADIDQWKKGQTCPTCGHHRTHLKVQAVTP